MSQPLASIEFAPAKRQAKVNLLPCHIDHNGPVSLTAGLWNPAQEQDEKSVAYFRGRKLYGKTVPLPQQYQGVVIEELAADTPEQPLPTDLESEEDQHMAPEKRKELQVKAEFNEMTIWDHEAMVDAAEDPYLRSMEEWVQLAEQIHSYGDIEKNGDDNQS